MTRCIQVITKEVKPKAKDSPLVKIKFKSMMEANKEGFLCKVCGITMKKHYSLRKHARSVHMDPPQKFELQMCECHQTINVFIALLNQRNAKYEVFAKM